MGITVLNPSYNAARTPRSIFVAAMAVCVVIEFPNGKGFPVTARPMTEREKRRFNRWKRQ